MRDLRRLKRWVWVPLVLGCVVIAGAVIAAWELGMAHFGVTPLRGSASTWPRSCVASPRRLASMRREGAG